MCLEITNMRDISLLFHFAGITEVMMMTMMTMRRRVMVVVLVGKIYPSPIIACPVSILDLCDPG